MRRALNHLLSLSYLAYEVSESWDQDVLWTINLYTSQKSSRHGAAKHQLRISKTDLLKLKRRVLAPNMPCVSFGWKSWQNLDFPTFFQLSSGTVIVWHVSGKQILENWNFLSDWMSHKMLVKAWCTCQIRISKPFKIQAPLEPSGWDVLGQFHARSEGIRILNLLLVWSFFLLVVTKWDKEKTNKYQ